MYADSEPTDRRTTRHDTDQSRGAEPSPQRRRRWVLPTAIAVGVVVVLLILIALIPTLLSTGPGARLVAGQVSDGIRGEVRIGELSLSWFGGQRAGNVTVLDEGGEETLVVDEATTELTLLDAIRGRYALGATQLSGVRADVVVDEDGENNLARALESVEPPDPDEPTRVPPSLRFDLALRDARATVHTAGVDEPVVFEDIQADAALAAMNEPLTLELSGRSQHADVAGGFTAEGQIAGLFADDGTLTLNNAAGNGSARAEDLPMPGIDRLLGLDGLLTDAVGELATLAFELDTAGDEPRFRLAANAPRLQTELLGVIRNNRLAALQQPAEADMELAPELAQRLFGLELQQAVPIQLDLTELRAPAGGFDPARTAITATVRFLEPAEFVDEQGTPFALRNVEGAIDTDNLADAAEFRLTADVDAEDREGDVRIAGTLREMFDEAGALQWDQLQADVVAEVNELPTVLADRLAGQDGLLLDALGDRVSLQAETSSVGADEIAAELTIDAPRLRTQTMQLQMDAERVVLVDPVQMELLVAPRVASQIVGAVTLANDEPATATLHAFEAPRPGEGEPLFQPDATVLDFELVGEEAIELVDVPQVEQATAENFALRINGESLGDLRLTLGGLLSHPDGRIEAIAGSPLEARLQVATGLDAEFQRSPLQTLLTLDADQLQGDLVATLAPDFSAIEISETSTLDVLLTRQMLAALDLDEQVDETMLSEPLQLALQIEGLSTPLPVDPAELEIDAVADVIAQAAEQRSDAFAIWLGGEQARVNVQAGPPAVAEGEDEAADEEAEDAAGPMTRLQLAVTADRLEGALAADVARQEDRTTVRLAEAATFQAVLSEAAMRMLNATGDDGESLVVGDVPLQARVNTLAGQVQPLAWPTLTADVDLTADRIVFAEGLLPTNGATAEQTDVPPGGVMEDVQASLAFAGEQGRAQLQLTGRTLTPGQTEPGRLAIDATLNEVLQDGELAIASATGEADITLEQVPTPLVAGLLEYEPLVPLLGPVANLTGVAEWQGLPPVQGTIDADLETEHLTAPLAFRVDDGFIELTRPTQTVLTLTPEAYDAFFAPAADEAEDEQAPAEPEPQQQEPAALGEEEALPAPRRLAEPGQVELNLQSLRWPMPAPAPEDADDPEAQAAGPVVDRSDLAFVATLGSEGLTFVGPEGGDAGTLSFDFQFSGEDLANPAPFELAGRITPAAAPVPDGVEAPGPKAEDADAPPEELGIAAEDAEFRFTGTIAELIDSRGRPDLDTMVVDVQGEATRLPVTWIDDWTEQEGVMLASLGPQIDLDVAAELRQLSGPVSLQATATNGDATVQGELEEGVFRPTSPITASLRVTEAMGSRVLRGIHPMFETAVSGEEPIRLNVPPEDVSIPLRPFSLTEANIPMARLELGRLAMRQGGTLAAVLSGTEQLIRQDLDAGEQVDAWFTPAVFELTDGRLRYERRLDMLLDDRLQMASWGEIDLAAGQISLDLGLPAEMLDRLFGLNVPEGSMLTIPMRGRLGEVPQMDWGRAAADIGRLAAQAEVAERAPIPGDLLGGVFGQLLETNVPPSSVSPLPWAEAELDPLPEAETPDPDQPEEEEPERERRPSLRDLLEQF